MKSVGYAWNLAPSWYSPIVATPCATAASTIGRHISQSPLSLFSFLLFFGFHAFNADWYVKMCSNRSLRSQSCPFCRGSLERVGSRDLWVLTSSTDVIDIVSLAKENLRLFYTYIENLPLMVPEPHLFLYDYLF